jgi:hypothetical protein
MGAVTGADAATAVKSNASDITVSATVAEQAPGSLGPFATASGASTAGSPMYGNSSSVLVMFLSPGSTVIGSTSTGVDLTSGTLSASASGSAHYATATAAVSNLELAINLDGAPFLTLGGGDSSISSTSTAMSSTPGGLQTVMGSSSVSGLTLSSLGNVVDLSASAVTPANTVVAIPQSLAGQLTITLNKQTILHPLGGESIETTAVYIDLTGVAQTYGDIAIGDSFAQAPEPAAWAMTLLGFGGVGAILRRRSGAAPSSRRRRNRSPGGPARAP